jgi:hypothetical protein
VRYRALARRPKCRRVSRDYLVATRVVSASSALCSALDLTVAPGRSLVDWFIAWLTPRVWDQLP